MSRLAENSTAEKLVRFVDVARSVLDTNSLITDPVELSAYQCDGLTSHRVVPKAAVVPRDRQELILVVRLLAGFGIPFVARGAGTGLSGGALPDADGVLVVTSRLKSIIEIDPLSRIAVVEPGVVNLELSRAASRYGLYFAPDPSSQIVCTIGGNVAENSGGAHCFKYGFTTNHVLGIEMITPSGELVQLGGDTIDSPGPDLRGVFVGSEGTLGVVTSVICRLMKIPQSHKTLIAYFGSVEDAGEAVSAIVASGEVPAAIEMFDKLAIEACELATGAGLDLGYEAALLVELDGVAVEVDAGFDALASILKSCGSKKVWVAETEEERAAMWKARKAAFPAAGRIAPAYIVQDGVIPRTRLPQVLAEIEEISKRTGLSIMNVFHAGDGNLHPLVTYNPDLEGQAELAEQAASEILSVCLKYKGSLTGEHGIGVDKVCHMPEMFSGSDLEAFSRLRRAFDPEGILNPGKLLPTPKLCGETGSKRFVSHHLEETGQANRW
jgi:glycolate oxidase